MKISCYIILVLFVFSCSSDENIGNTNDFIKGEFLDDWTFKIFMDSPFQNSFKLWVPENTNVRAVLVLAPGGAANGTGLVNSSDWQEYAKKEKLALLGVQVNSDFTIASSNLLYALNKISQERELDYIANLPLLLRGFSHGGVFSYRFAYYYSNKTIAYSNIKGTIQKENVRLPPGLLITGSDDLDYRNEFIFESFLLQRQQKAITCFAEEPNVGHGIGNSDVLTRAFFTAVLKERLQGVELSTLQEDNYFLGDNSTFQYDAYNSFSEKKEESSCLIDEDFIQVWLNTVQ